MTEPEPTLDSKQRLIQAAKEVFSEKGFKAATIREIVERANANIAAVNYHFGDKERLYIEACKHAHECSTFESPMPSWPEGMPPKEKLSLFVRRVVEGMAVPASPVSMQLIMREMANPTEAAREIVREFIQPMAQTLRGILRELFPSAEEHRLLMIGFSIMGQCLFYRQNRNISKLIFPGVIDAIPVEAIADHVVRFTLAALGFAAPVAAADLEAPL